MREHPLRSIRFVADAHLGGLAHLLRMTGFDTLYDNNFRDEAIEAIAASEGRIVLSRDRELFKRRGITHGCYVRALHSVAQLREVFARLDLAGSARPFTLCLACNAPLHGIDKALVLDRLPPSVRERYDRFSTCDRCGGVFWEGSHWRRMRALVDELAAQRLTTLPGSRTVLSQAPRAGHALDGRGPLYEMTPDDRGHCGLSTYTSTPSAFKRVVRERDRALVDHVIVRSRGEKTLQELCRSMGPGSGIRCEKMARLSS